MGNQKTEQKNKLCDSRGEKKAQNVLMSCLADVKALPTTEDKRTWKEYLQKNKKV